MTRSVPCWYHPVSPPMNGSHRAVELSDDVLRLVLDDFSLLQLRQAARVSRQWRAVALAHPTYSRNVSLRLYGHSAYNEYKRAANAIRAGISFFLQRLGVSNSLGNVVSLELSLNFGRQFLNLYGIDWTVTFKAAAACIERVDFLSLRINECLLPMAAVLFSLPAPRLVEFRLGLHGSATRHLLRGSLFSRNAPCLKKLHLDGWAFSLPLVDAAAANSSQRAASPIAALSHVTEVRLQTNWSYHDSKAIHLERFFVHCPQLERLVLRGACSDAVLSSAQRWSALPRPEVLNLRHLSLLGDDVVPNMQISGPDPEIEAWERDVTAVVRAFGHAQMETLEVNTIATSEPTLVSILSHFGVDPLHLSASTASGKYLRLTLHSLTRPCERTFVHMLSYTDQVDEAMFRRCLAPLATQIVQLTVHRTLTAWHFVAELFEDARTYVGVLPRVKRISVVLGFAEGDMRDDKDRYSQSSHAGHCCFHLGVTSLNLHALERVELVGPAEDPLDVEDVALLMGKGLLRTARRDLVLVLKDVQLEGDLRAIWGYFSSIELDSDASGSRSEWRA